MRGAKTKAELLNHYATREPKGGLGALRIIIDHAAEGGPMFTLIDVGVNVVFRGNTEQVATFARASGAGQDNNPAPPRSDDESSGNERRER